MQRQLDPTIVTFYIESKQNNWETEQAGKAIYDDILYVHKVVPFKEKDSFRGKASDKDKRQYPNQYQAFLNREKHDLEGTTIQNWNFPNESQVKMLSSHGVHTVEQVAALGDDSVARMGGQGRVLRDTAKKYIMQGDAVDNRNKIADLEATCAELKEQIANLLEARETKPKVKKDDPTDISTKRRKRNGATSSTS